MQNVENNDPRVTLRNNQLLYHHAHTQSDALPSLLDHSDTCQNSLKPDYKRDSKATAGIDEDWIAEKSTNSNASSAIIQIKHTPRPETRDMATNTENNNNQQEQQQQLSETSNTIQLNTSNNVNNDSESLPDSPRLQEEILMLENEVEQGKEALRQFAIETQAEKNKLNCRINDLEDELAEKDKLNYDNQHELEQLVDEALLKEQELSELKNQLNLNEDQKTEIESLKNQVSECEAKILDQENLNSEIEKYKALFEAEQVKVQELQEQIDHQESVVLNLGDYENSGGTPISSPRKLNFPEKIAELEQTIIIARKTDKIQKKNDQCQEELLRNIQHIGELERQLEYYRLGLSPTPNENNNNVNNNNNEDPTNITSSLIKAQEEQIENLSSRYEHSQQQHSLALENIQNLKNQNDQLKSENIDLVNQIKQIATEQDRLNSTLAQNNALKENLSEQDKNIRVILSSKEVELEELKRKLAETEKLLNEADRRHEIKKAEFTAAVSPMISPRTPPEFNDSYLNKSMTAQLSVALEEKDRIESCYKKFDRYKNYKLYGSLISYNAQISCNFAFYNNFLHDRNSACG